MLERHVDNLDLLQKLIKFCATGGRTDSLKRQDTVEVQHNRAHVKRGANKLSFPAVSVGSMSTLEANKKTFDGI